MTEEEKMEYLGKLRRFRVGRLHYALERIVKTFNQILPFVPAPKYDYVRGIRLSD